MVHFSSETARRMDWGLLPLRRTAFPPCDQAAEPVHLGAGVVQGRDTQEDILFGGLVVVLFHLCRVHQSPVLMQDGLGKAGGAGGKVNGRVILVCERDLRRPAGAVGGVHGVILGEAGTSIAHIVEQAVFSHFICDLFHAADELRPEEKNVYLRQVQAVLNLVRRVAEVQGNGQGSGFQDSEIYGKPFQTVHKKDGYLISFFYPPLQQQIGHAVGFFIKDTPGDLPAVIGRPHRLDQLKFSPGDPAGFRHLRVDLHKTYVVSVELCVSFQELCDWHLYSSTFYGVSRVKA